MAMKLKLIPFHLTLLSALYSGSIPSAMAADGIPVLNGVDLRGDCRGDKSKYPGKTEKVGETFALVAHGTEFGHHCGQDQGHFAYTEVEGDFDVSVQVVSLTNGGAQRYDGHATVAKGGLMVREGNDPGARYVAIWAASNDTENNVMHKYPDAFHFDVRLDSEAWLGSKPEGRFRYGVLNSRDGDWFKREYPNVWLRLKREGNKFFAFVSKDGKTWNGSLRIQQGKSWVVTPSHAFEVELPRVLNLGVALSSAAEGHPNARATAVFQDVRGFPPARPVGSSR